LISNSAPTPCDKEPKKGPFHDVPPNVRAKTSF